MFNFQQRQASRSRQRKFALEQLEDRLVLSSSSVFPIVLQAAPFAGNGGVVNNAIVQSYYRNVLNRNAEPSGLASWVGQLNSGVSPQTVATGFYSSTEYLTDVVNSYYQTYLGRTGESAGVQHWISAIQGGDRLQTVATDFLSSPEYLADHPGNTAYVESLYTNVLGRTGETAGINSWVNALNSGANPATVAADFVNSAESDALIVNSDYTNFLQRPGESAGVQNWISAIQRGVSLQTIGADFLSTSEYIADATNAASQSMPVVTTQPISQSVALGGTVNLTAAASGNPTTVQWETGYYTESLWTVLTDGSGVSGSTTDTLTLSDYPAIADGSQYRALFSNSVGAVSTVAATISISPIAPVITTQPANLSPVQSGTPVTYTAIATGYPLTLQWEMSANNFQSWILVNSAGNTKITNTIVGNGLQSQLTIPAGLDADGNALEFRVTFSNGKVTATSTTVTLAVVTVAPTITSQPKSETVPLFGMAAFSVRANGTPSLNYQWQSDNTEDGRYIDLGDGTTLDGATISGAKSSDLTITGVNLDENNVDYRAVVSNGVTSVTSDSATLTLG